MLMRSGPLPCLVSMIARSSSNSSQRHQNHNLATSVASCMSCQARDPAQGVTTAAPHCEPFMLNMRK